MESMEITTTPTSLNVFITGASNALGREVTRQLVAKGHRVTGVTTGSSEAALVRQDGGIAAFADLLRVGELKSAMLVARPDVVMHLAAQNANHVPFTNANWDAQARIASDGTAALLAAAAAVEAKFVIYPSYAFIYGDTHGEWVDETAPRLNPSQYEESAVLRALMQGEDAAANASIPACTARLGYVYSAESEATAALRTSLQQGKPLVLGKSQYANWIHASDAARALLLAVEQQPAGQVYNIVDDHPTAPAQFVNYLAEVMGLQPNHAPNFAKPLLSGKMQRALLDMSLQARNAKAKAELGWTPRYPLYQAGLDQILLIWRAQQPVR